MIIWKKHTRSEWIRVSPECSSPVPLEDADQELAPSQAEIRLKLTMSENKAGLASGRIGWLNEGIGLEQSQYVHSFDILLMVWVYVFISQRISQGGCQEDWKKWYEIRVRRPRKPSQQTSDPDKHLSSKGRSRLWWSSVAWT